MTELFTIEAVTAGGAAAAAGPLALRAVQVPGARRRVTGGAAAVAAVLAALADHTAVLALAWLAASVATSARDAPTDHRAAVAVLGDALAAAAFVGLALDRGSGDLPFGPGPAAPAWLPGLLATGVTVRAVASGMREPGLLALACLPAARFAATGLDGVDLPVLVGLGGVAALAAWTEGPLAGVPVLGVSLFGVAHPVASEAATFALAGAAVAAAGVALSGAPAVGSRWRSPRSVGPLGPWLAATEGPPGGVTAGALAALAAVPAGVGLFHVPVDRTPAVAVAVAATLAVLGAAATAAGARRLRPGALSFRAGGAAAAGAVLALALLTPGGYADALDLDTAPESSLADVVGRGRDGLLGAAAFAPPATGLVLVASRPRGRPRLPAGEETAGRA